MLPAACAGSSRPPSAWPGSSVEASSNACAGQGAITAPGSVGATPVESPIDIEEGLPVEVPLVYFFGSPSPTDNLVLYRYIVERLAAVLDKRASLSPQVRLTPTVTR